MKTSNHYKVFARHVSTVNDLEWIANLLSTGYIQGKHISNRLETGQEFQQYRAYVHGDDARAIDWKMYARSGKFYIRQSMMETEHNFMFILDNSNSMGYAENEISKLEICKILCATLSKIITNQTDAFAVYGSSQIVSQGTGLKHWKQSLQALIDLENTDSTSKLPIPDARSNTIIVWMTDGYMKIREIEEYLASLKNPNTEILLILISGEKEKNLNFANNMTFIDLETKEKIELNTEQYRSTYQEKLDMHFHKIKNVCYRIGVWYHPVLMQEDLMETIRSMLYKYNYLYQR